MAIEKPSRGEEEYFAKQDAELIHKSQEITRAMTEESQRRSHFMKCPKDGYDLSTTKQGGVQIDSCPHCHGIWLDAGELEQLMSQEDGGGALKRVIGDVLTAMGRSRKPSKEAS